MPTNLINLAEAIIADGWTYDNVLEFNQLTREEQRIVETIVDES